jgi:hypothetical protein
MAVLKMESCDAKPFIFCLPVYGRISSDKEASRKNALTVVDCRLPARNFPTTTSNSSAEGSSHTTGGTLAFANKRALDSTVFPKLDLSHNIGVVDNSTATMADALNYFWLGTFFVRT